MQITTELEKQLAAKKEAEYILNKVVKVADLENFEVFTYAPCYRRLIVGAPNYFIDLDTNSNVGQEVRLVMYPDGSLEQSHYAIYCPETGQQWSVKTEEIPYTKFYKDNFLNNRD